MKLFNFSRNALVQRPISSLMAFFFILTGGFYLFCCDVFAYRIQTQSLMVIVIRQLITMDQSCRLFCCDVVLFLFGILMDFPVIKKVTMSLSQLLFYILVATKHGHSSPLSCPVSDTRPCQCPIPTPHPYYVLYFGHYRCPRVRVGVGASQLSSGYLKIDSAQLIRCLFLEYFEEPYAIPFQCIMPHFLVVCGNGSNTFSR